MIFLFILFFKKKSEFLFLLGDQTHAFGEFHGLVLIACGFLLAPRSGEGFSINKAHTSSWPTALTSTPHTADSHERNPSNRALPRALALTVSAGKAHGKMCTAFPAALQQVRPPVKLFLTLFPPHATALLRKIELLFPVPSAHRLQGTPSVLSLHHLHAKHPSRSPSMHWSIESSLRNPYIFGTDGVLSCSLTLSIVSYIWPSALPPNTQ